MIEKATDILYALDQNLVLTFWSPGAEAALGWTAAEAVGRFGPEFVHPEDTPRMVAPAENEPLGSSLELSFRVRHKDGTYRTVEAMVRNLLADPAVKGIIVNARDVTEKLALEARSVESQKLESIGRLAGGVAHDFNNLLTVILTCGELMKSAIDEGQEIVVDDLREILAAANRAKDLTQQLLAFARRQVIAPVVVDINRLIDNQLPLLRRLAGEDIMFKVGLAPSPCNLCCDPGQLQQVLLNLVVNARDAMPRGGVLEIATDIVDIPTPSHTDSQEILHGSFIRLRVKDTGEGISDEVRAHLFEPFFTTKPKGIGVGLGLATVYGIVKQSKGVINVSSSPGYGATFDILWPKSETPPSHIPTSNTTGTKGSEIVLLVEDDRSVGQVTARILREAGYQVLYASNAEDAISAAKQQSRIDLLVTDVVMPGLDGRQVADAIVAVHHQMRVLFMSGYTQNAIVHHGVIDEGINFLPKPFTPTALLSRVRDVLSLPVSS